jgi:hypothetical protein
MQKVDATHRYIHGRMRRIEGWYTRLDADITAAVARDQQARGVTGSIGEIGVHHGRAFIALALCLQPGERAFAIDIFGDQQLNQDRSGCGDLDIFRANLAAHDIDPSRVGILQSSSTAIGWPDIEPVAGSHARLFSIDGGHTAPVVENDLEIAHAGLCDAGVVIADDYFDSGYPGVSEGTARFMLRHPNALRPFAIGDSRLYLCRPDFAEHYRDVVANSLAAARHVLNAELWGGNVGVYRTPSGLRDRVRGWPITKAVLRRGWGQQLKPVVKKVLEPV